MEFREIRMEVVSYDEAIEYCKNNGLEFDHVYIGKGSNYGKIMMLAYKKEYPNYENEASFQVEEPKEYIIYAITDNGKLFVTRSGTSFKIGEAALFTHKQAKAKAKAMTINSKRGYIWVIRRK